MTDAQEIPHIPPLVGTRIRDRRLDLGLRQGDVARAIGISPSYLNLIEHGRRPIGGKLLADLARALGTSSARLSQGAEGGVIDAMQAAAAAQRGQVPAIETDRAGDLAGRFPGWAQLIVAQADRIAALEARLATLTDRMAHDPHLSGALHEVISAVTSIRSTAAILVADDGLDRDWQARFHANIHADSLRLADTSQSLIRSLDAAGTAATPAEAAARALDALGAHVPALEGAGARPAPAQIVKGMAGLDPAAARIVADRLARYRADALALPLARFAPVARDCGHDPIALARHFGRDLATVLRRLATLPPGAGHPPMGLAICDGAGTITELRPLPGLRLPRSGGGCPLWPLWQALLRPGRAIRAAVDLPAADGRRFDCHAVAVPRVVTGSDEPEVIEAVMLVRSDPPEGLRPVIRAGISCRVCPRPSCPARHEASILDPPV